MAAALQDQLMARLRERAPVNRKIIEEVATEVLSGRSHQEFIKWLDAHETYLIGRING